MPQSLHIHFLCNISYLCLKINLSVNWLPSEFFWNAICPHLVCFKEEINTPSFSRRHVFSPYFYRHVTSLNKYNSLFYRDIHPLLLNPPFTLLEKMLINSIMIYFTYEFRRVNITLRWFYDIYVACFAFVASLTGWGHIQCFFGGFCELLFFGFVTVKNYIMKCVLKWFIFLMGAL